MSVLVRYFDWRPRWRRRSLREETPCETALLPRAMLSILEDVLAWDNPHLSLGFLAFVNVVFMVFAHASMSVLEFAFTVGMMVTCLDALETWLRHKHRTVCLERLAECDNTHIHRTLVRARRWLARRKEDFLVMREANPTKAFLLANILMGGAMVVGKAISGAMLLYLLTMAIVLFPVASPPVLRFLKKIHQVADSDGEMDGLLPELSEHNIKELNFEAESIAETRQSVEPWLPEGAPPGDSSDSDGDSHSSSHLPVTANNALEPLHSTDSTDSSEDEYLPQCIVIVEITVRHLGYAAAAAAAEEWKTQIEIAIAVAEEEKVHSTVKVLPPDPVTWSGSAVSALWNFSGAISGLVARASPHLPADKRKRFHSADSSDDFEFIDQSDL